MGIPSTGHVQPTEHVQYVRGGVREKGTPMGIPGVPLMDPNGITFTEQA